MAKFGTKVTTTARKKPFNRPVKAGKWGAGYKPILPKSKSR